MNNPKLVGTAVKQRNITLFGNPESGKSTRLESFRDYLCSRYGRKNVATQILKARDFRKLLDAPRWERRMVQLIGIEDCTNRKFSADELEEFWQLRHKMQEKTGLSRGLLVLVFTAHSFFRLQKELRSDPKAVVLLDVPENPLNPADTRVAEQLIPNLEDRQWLNRKSNLALDDPDMLGYAWAVLEGRPAGFIYLPHGATVGEKKFKRFPRFAMPHLKFSIDKTDLALTVFILGLLASWLNITPYLALDMQVGVGIVVIGILMFTVGFLGQRHKEA